MAFGGNFIIGLMAGLTVNLLADWLPRLGQTHPQPASAHRPVRWIGVFGAGLLWPLFLDAYGQATALSAPADHWLLWFCFVLFLLILVIDLEHRRVLNVVVYPTALLALALSFFRADISPAGALAGGVTGFGLFLLLFTLRPGALGAGDVKLAGLIGLFVGFPGVFVALFAGIGLGGLAAAALLILRRAGRKSTMAYAPYLSTGAMVALLYGQMILHWYAGRLGIL